jgi:oligopeptide transport system substrate-binding protein
MNIQRLIFLALTFSLFTVNGCKKNENEANIQSRTLTLNLQEGDPPSLNPYVGVDLRSRCLYLSLYEPLMRRRSDGQLELAAAESVEVSPDQMTYTFQIRPHLWSNGEPVTSYHFREAWLFSLKPDSPCVRSDLFYPIKNAEEAKKGILSLDAVKIACPDEKRLIVELEHPTPYFLDLTASSFFLPLYNPSIEEPQYTNGPFTVSDRQLDDYLLLAKNPFYWDSLSVQIDKIKFLMVSDPITALALFEKGELDIVGDPFSTLPFDVIPSLTQSKRLETKIVSRMFYLLINTDTPHLNNPSLRKALSLSIDRNLFVQHLFFGQFPSFSLIPQPLSKIDYENFEQLYQEDAATLFEHALSELGYTRNTFPPIILSYAELAGQKKMAEYVQECWEKKLGIHVELVCSEWNVHSANLKRKNFQVGALHLTTLYQDPMFYFDLFRNKENFSNYCNWESPIFKEFLLKSDHVEDAEERISYLKAAELYLIDQMPAIPLFTQNFQYLKKENVSISLTDLGIYDFKGAFKTPSL